MKCPMMIKEALSAKLLGRASDLAVNKFLRTVYKYPKFALNRQRQARKFFYGMKERGLKEIGKRV